MAGLSDCHKTIVTVMKSQYENKTFNKLVIDRSRLKKQISKKQHIRKLDNLVESEEIITDEKRVSEISNEYFGNIVASLNIPKTEFDSRIIKISTAIKRYELLTVLFLQTKPFLISMLHEKMMTR